VVGLLGGSLSAQELALSPQRTSPFDLALTGKLQGLPADGVRYVAWSQLRALPVKKIRIDGEFFTGEQEVTVLFLDELWQHLPRADGADTLLGQCNDGYASVFTRDFIAHYRPFLVLEINGAGPSHWPPPGMKYNPGPYVISISAGLQADVARLIDAGHKKPWGVTTIEVASFAERFRGVQTGPYATVTPEIAAGRDLWINSCACCHEGPGKIFGGTKSGQPFAVLRAIAASDPVFFKRYVREPQAVSPSAKMEAHPHYSEAQLDALIAFIRRAPPP
jgi:cytochrome c2